MSGARPAPARDVAELAAFRKKFHLGELEIFANRSWVWSVRPEQPTLGAGILSLSRPCPAFGQTSRREGADLTAIVALAERALRDAFGPTRFNYLMLMMVDHHLHFHLLPRYRETRAALGKSWGDGAWPRPPDLFVDHSGLRGLHALRDLLRSFVPALPEEES